MACKMCNDTGRLVLLGPCGDNGWVEKSCPYCTAGDENDRRWVGTEIMPLLRGYYWDHDKRKRS